MRRLLVLFVLHLIIIIGAAAQGDSITREATVQEVTITSANSLRRLGGAVAGVSIGRQELFKAACCNLGESFTTNPSVDVSYSDAATGAKQIRLLGLSGTYVQMLTEQMPNLRGAALPYALDYVPGPWMQSIQVSKGTSTVKNGYESIAGQIDIEFLKPNDVPHLNANIYGDSKGRLEANFDGNIHLTDHLSTMLLLHGENAFAHHDDNNDTFLDMPRRRQYHLSNRWKLLTDSYIMHAGLSILNDYRRGGQTAHTMEGHEDRVTTTVPSNVPNHVAALGIPFYEIVTEATRYEAYTKHAFVLNANRQENIALMASGALHLQDACYGMKTLDNNEKTLDLQLMYESQWPGLGRPDLHQLSAGLSLSHYYSRLHFTDMDSGFTSALTEILPFQPQYISAVYVGDEAYYKSERSTDRETTSGAYAQYTLHTGKLTVMAGLRGDYSDRWHWFLTPRLHLRYAPSDLVTLRLSIGKGYRTTHLLAEQHYLLATNRLLNISEPLQQESAWNMGLNSAWTFSIGSRTLLLNTEYYYTNFQQQTVVDYTDARYVADGFQTWSYRLPTITVANLHGRSYSHTAQIDATCTILDGLTATAACRWTDSRCYYPLQNDGQGEMLERPLTSRYKGLLSLSYAPGLQLWHFDATLQLNGGGRIVGHERFHAYEQLQAQVTRDFRHLSVYVGGENLTNVRQRNPVRSASWPWGSDFDATLVWGPVHGPLFYFGIRYNLEKI